MGFSGRDLRAKIAYGQNNIENEINCVKYSLCNFTHPNLKGCTYI
jgi:hypothetical protein